MDQSTCIVKARFKTGPDGFYNAIKKEFQTMKSRKKCPKSGDIKVCKTELIYS